MHGQLNEGALSVQKWEYKSFTCYNSDFVTEKEKCKEKLFTVDEKKLNGIEYLNFLGSSGWELFCVVPHLINGHSADALYILRRIVE